jgi:hypothetical protein
VKTVGTKGDATAEALAGLTGRVNSLESFRGDAAPKIETVYKREYVESGLIQMGAFGGNELRTWETTFPSNTRAVCGYALDTDGAGNPLLGSAMPQTWVVGTQRENGQLKVRVAFQPHWNAHNHCFQYIAVKVAQ